MLAYSITLFSPEGPIFCAKLSSAVLHEISTDLRKRAGQMIVLRACLAPQHMIDISLPVANTSEHRSRKATTMPRAPAVTERFCTHADQSEAHHYMHL